MKKSGFLRISLLLVLCLSLSDSLYGQGPYPLKKIKFKGKNSTKVREWVVTGPDAGLLFVSEWKGVFSEDLLCYPLNQKGKLGKPVTLLKNVSAPMVVISPPNVSSGIHEVSALWVGDHGLVFVIYNSAKKMNKVKLAVGSFDPHGKIIKPLETIDTITSPKDNQILWGSVAVKESDFGAIGVVYSTNFYLSNNQEFGWRVSKAFLLELDPDGNKLIQPFQIRIPNSGNFSFVDCNRPAWRNQKWLIPSTRVRFKKKFHPAYNYTSFDPVATDLVVFILTRSGPASFQSRTKTLRRDRKSKGLFTFTGINFLGEQFFEPYAGSAAIGSTEDLLLFYQHKQEIPVSQQAADLYSYTYNMQRLSWQGGKKGKPDPLYFPPWNHTIGNIDPKNIYYYINEVSVPVAAQDGRFVLSQIRSLLVLPGSNPAQGEHQLSVYKFNAFNGKVEIINRADLTGTMSYTPAIIRRFKSYYAALCEGFFQGFATYFSRF